MKKAKEEEMERIKELIKDERKTVILGLIGITILYITKLWIYCYANHSVVIGLGMSIWNDICSLGLIIYFNFVLYGIQEEKPTCKIAKWILMMTTLVDLAITIICMVKIAITPNFYLHYLIEEVIHFIVISICIWYFIRTIFQGKVGYGNWMFVGAILVDFIYDIILDILRINDVNILTLFYGILALCILPYFYQIRKSKIKKTS